MCGGIGSRFWPYSRTDVPKQFIDFFGTGSSLLQMTYERMLPLVDKERFIVITNAKYVERIKEQLPELDDSQILAEPDRRNTAPAIAWAAYHIRALDPEASMIVAPSDHLSPASTYSRNAWSAGLISWKPMMPCLPSALLPRVRKRATATYR